MNFAKFLRTPFPTEHLRWLLLLFFALQSGDTQLFLSLREKSPNTEFFWPTFLCIRTEYRKIRTRKNSIFGQFSFSVVHKVTAHFYHFFFSNKQYVLFFPWLLSIYHVQWKVICSQITFFTRCVFFYSVRTNFSESI